MKKIQKISAGILLISSSAWGQGTVLLKDINPTGLSAPTEAASLAKVNPGSGEIMIISVQDSLHGSEVWKSDGTPGGTAIIKDIVPGNGGSAPVNLTPAGTQMFFSAANDASPPKRNLWASNGMAAGTNLVKDLGFFGSDGPEKLFNFNGTLYFQGFSGTAGLELWRSNGTDVGTVLVSDIRPGGGDSAIDHFYVSGTGPSAILYFTATDGQNDVGLYRLNPAGTGVERLGVSEPLFQQFGRIAPQYVNMNGLTYFSAFSGNGVELWRTDGTAGGTQEVFDLFPGPSSSEPAHMTVMTITGQQAGTYLYYSATDGAISGVELWRSDGNPLNTPEQLKDIFVGGDSSNPSQLMVVGSNLFFTADDGSGVELHATNGRTGNENSARVVDIVAGTGGSNPGNFVNFNNTTLLFTAVDSSNNLGLYTCASGASLPNAVTRIKSLGIESTASHMTRLGSKVFFLLNNSQLWETDLTNSPAGNSNGTKMVFNFRSGSRGSSSGEFAVAGTDVYFSADDGVAGRELWKSDGSDAGTMRLADIFPGDDGSFPPTPNSSDPLWITPCGPNVFLSAENANANRELWIYDPTANPAVFQVKEINPTGPSNPENLFDLNGLLLFTAEDGSGFGTTGRELWRSNGTEAGTVQVADLVTGPEGSFPRQFTRFKNEVYFFAGSDGVGRELMKINGTGTTVTLVKDIAPGGLSSINEENESMAVMGSGASERLYFSARNESQGGRELWTSNGTDAGTVRVKDINPTGDSLPRQITTVDKVVFFTATDGVNGTELWRSNGTEAGTVLVRDINAGAPGSDPQELTASGKLIFFTADNGLDGRELWTSNGTLAGTVMLTDFRNGGNRASSMGITGLKDVDGVLCFSADDGVNGRELWISDGTVAGTRMINDISGIPTASSPGGFTPFRGQLLYTAADTENGDEPRIAFIGSDIRVEQPAANQLTHNGPAVDFGVADVAAKESTMLIFTIRNAGLNTLRDIKPVLGGINAGEFSLLSTPKPASSLAQNATTTFGVKFTPKEGGPRVAQVSIISNDGDENPFIVNVTGTGVKDPTITDHPDSLMRNVGEAAAFDAMAASSSVALTNADYQWRRNNGAIKGALGTGFNIPAVTLKEAGAYTVAVKVGKILGISNPAQLGVVQANTPPAVLVVGKTKSATMKVSAAGNGLTYQWFLGAVPVANTADGRVKGAQTPTLVIGNLDEPDSGLYSCQVTGPGGMRAGGHTELKVFTEKPVLDDPQNMPDGIIGGSYGFPMAGFDIKVDPAPEKAPTTYTAANLPAGLKVNPKTGKTRGRPTKAFPAGRDVTLGAANTQKADPVVETIIIKDFPANLAGTYSGTVDPDPALNDGLGGRIDVTISATGALTGTLTLGAERIPLKGGIEVDAAEVLPPNYTVTLKRKNGTNVTLAFDMIIDNIVTTQRLLTGNANGIPVNGWRHAVPAEAAAFQGYYTFGLELGDPGHPGQEHIPQGWSYGAFTVDKNGKWKIAGRTADGETITCAASVGFAGQMVVFQTLYKPLAGSLWGSLVIDPVDTNNAEDNSLSGDVNWVRPANTNTKTRAYQAGFGLPGTPEASPVPLEATGGIYVDPTKTKVLIMGLASPGTQTNLNLDFEQGDLPTSTQDPDQILGILDGNKIANPKPAGPTSTLIKKLAAKTGLFDGTFRLTDPDQRTGATGNLTRDAVFHGILIRDDVEMKTYGVGHFLLEKRPQDGEVPKKTVPVLGGWFELREN